MKSTDTVPSNQIAVGMRVLVISPPDAKYPREIFWGAGVVSFTAERTEVMFDNGSGGMFPNDCIRREPRTWAEIANRLRASGWETRYLPLSPDVPPYLWRSPEGISGSGFRGGHQDAPPEAVMDEAVWRGDIPFAHLASV